MGDYLVVSCRPGDAAARLLSLELAQRAEQEGMALSEPAPHAWLAVRGPAAPGLRRIGGWTLIGDVLDRRSPILPDTAPDDPWDYERKLVARFWGRYVGIRWDVQGQPAALLRDPSGALECVAWSQAGLTVICSSPQDWFIRRLRPDWSINVPAVAAAVHTPLAGTGALLLRGPKALEPGAVQPFPLSEPPAAIWRPVDFARLSLDPAPSTGSAMSRLRDVVDEAVSGLAGLGGPMAMEVSGGLDSSIVAASLVHEDRNAGPWIHAYGSTPESDERSFVRLLGRALGFDPLCVPHQTAPMDRTWFDAVSSGFRPGLNGMDLVQDRAWGRHIRAAGASAVMTGKGGDSILFQGANVNVFTDLWRAKGWRALAWPDLQELAAANEISIWTMLRTARRDRRGGPRPLRRAHPILAPLPAPLSLHPWLRDCETLGPAKTFQIAGVIDGVSHHGPSALNRAVDVRHPLCAQPVVEACLQLPTALLALGARDRGLARQAFRDRLPPEIAGRRSKGEMTRIYGRMVSDNLDFLRPWLMEGRLAALGVIDYEAADAELTPEALMWRGRYADILTAAAYEGWVRCWERRLGPAG